MHRLTSLASDGKARKIIRENSNYEENENPKAEEEGGVTLTKGGEEDDGEESSFSGMHTV